MSRVVHAARGWIGTPYVHQASAKGAGTDCLGLIRGIWREFFGAEPEPMPAYTPDWGEMGGRELLMLGAGRLLQPATEEAPGDVLIFRMSAGAVAKHMGILTQTGTAPRFIHAYDRHGVVESPLSAPWRLRIAGRFRFPTID
ncbi:NlpC/P60 family protein [Paracoccus laeviglucosivorans]|uniref:Putative phage cell wall peptidase, NlpC/P60 family n=1 Tax=Paracoccus laeviglucosivorans TaxID=1197861 RepID=A0A521CHR1_9RHOB|nr:NlpC/P60 family protein [Paracoccus laeviglucosivorans]SMO59013.1 putative phage cell wall peptidase, NlpC/P60 family [Paracoccus laeviglucosivorans]